MKTGFFLHNLFCFLYRSFAQDASILQASIHSELVIVSRNGNERVVISEGEKLIIKTHVQGMRSVSGYFRSVTDSALNIEVANPQQEVDLGVPLWQLAKQQGMEVPFKKIVKLGVKGKNSSAEGTLGVMVIVLGVPLVIGGTTGLLENDGSTAQPATLVSPKLYTIGAGYELLVTRRPTNQMNKK